MRITENSRQSYSKKSNALPWSHASLCVPVPLTPCVLSLSQWMANGRPGASGPLVAQSVPTGAGGSAQPRPRRMEARTARDWCYSPRTAPTGSACRVSASALGSRKDVAIEKPAKDLIIVYLLTAVTYTTFI